MTYNPDIEGDIPEDVLRFLSELNSAISRGDIPSVNTLYEKRFEELSQEHYRQSQWPSPTLEKVTNCFRGNEVSLSVYSFMAYRNAFTNNAQQAIIRASWETFTALFQYVAGGDLKLPSWMLWDIFDEFAYQISAVHQAHYTPEEGEWTAAAAIATLDKVLELSELPAELTSAAEVEDITKAQQTPMLSGFFAVITKTRISMLSGDYHAALAALERLNLFDVGRDIAKRVPPANITIFYIIGFCYLMLRRYEDSSSFFNRCFTISIKGRIFSERIRSDALHLYVCARVLGGMSVSDLRQHMEHNRGKMLAFEDTKEALLNGDEERFCDVFERCGPKFICTIAGDGGVTCADGKDQQIRMFRRTVQQQQDLIKLRGYFGVYQNTKVSLFATNLGTDDGFSPLFALKMRSRQLVHDGKSANLLTGEYRVSVQYDCIVSGDDVTVVHCATYNAMETRMLRRIQNVKNDIRQIEAAKSRAEAQEEQIRRNKEHAEKAAAEAAAKEAASKAPAASSKATYGSNRLQRKTPQQA